MYLAFFFLPKLQIMWNLHRLDLDDNTTFRIISTSAPPFINEIWRGGIAHKKGIGQNKKRIF